MSEVQGAIVAAAATLTAIAVIWRLVVMPSWRIGRLIYNEIQTIRRVVIDLERDVKRITRSMARARRDQHRSKHKHEAIAQDVRFLRERQEELEKKLDSHIEWKIATEERTNS